jgi:hypothetical protein
LLSFQCIKHIDDGSATQTAIERFSEQQPVFFVVDNLGFGNDRACNIDAICRTCSMVEAPMSIYMEAISGALFRSASLW